MRDIEHAEIGNDAMDAERESPTIIDFQTGKFD
jgi:hypothetical protein